jgi:diphthine-ammonia ligase
MDYPTVILWSGGKDSVLALYIAKQQGIQVDALAILHPDDYASEFSLNFIDLLKKQATALDLPLLIVDTPLPTNEHFSDAIEYLASVHKTSRVLMGNTSIQSNQKNHLKDSLTTDKVELLTPIWELLPDHLMQTLFQLKFEILIFGINKNLAPKKLLGKRITPDFYPELKKLAESFPFSLSGVNDEYNTVVLDCPLFKKRLQPISYMETTVSNLHLLDIRNVALIKK